MHVFAFLKECSCIMFVYSPNRKRNGWRNVSENSRLVLSIHFFSSVCFCEEVLSRILYASPVAYWADWQARMQHGANQNAVTIKYGIAKHKPSLVQALLNTQCFVVRNNKMFLFCSNSKQMPKVHYSNCHNIVCCFAIILVMSSSSFVHRCSTACVCMSCGKVSIRGFNFKEINWMNREWWIRIDFNIQQVRVSQLCDF